MVETSETTLFRWGGMPAICDKFLKTSSKNKSQINNGFEEKIVKNKVGWDKSLGGRRGKADDENDGRKNETREDR